MTTGTVTVSIKEDVHEKLRQLKIHERESFNSVISRLLLKNSQ